MQVRSLVRELRSHVPCSAAKKMGRNFLVVQWLRIYLPTKGTQVRSLVQEDSTCRGQLSPCSTATEALSLSSTRREAPSEKPTHHNQRRPCSLHLEKAHRSKNEYIVFFKVQEKILYYWVLGASGQMIPSSKPGVENSEAHSYSGE